jgi:hypothetical protein
MLLAQRRLRGFAASMQSTQLNISALSARPRDADRLRTTKSFA